MHKDGYLKKLENVCHVGKSPQHSFFSNAGALVVLTAMWNSFTPSLMVVFLTASQNGGCNVCPPKEQFSNLYLV